MGLVERLKRFTRGVARVVTAVLLAAGLFFSYFVGIALTRLLMVAFGRRLLRVAPGRGATYWVEATGYGTDIDDSLRPS
jgi:hypothetical protein